VWKRVLFKALACIIYIRERYFFSLVCTFKKATKNFEVKVDEQKRGPRKILIVDVLISSNYLIHTNDVLFWDRLL
jgi:hypothetical protein